MRVILREYLVIPSPGRLRPRLLQLAMFKRKGRVPTGERRVVRFYHNTPEAVYLPRGLLPQVAAIIPCEIDDRRLALPPVEFSWRGQLRPEQAAAVDQLIKLGGSGVVIGMTGAGKTETAMGAIAALKQPAIWLTHTKPLKDQAIERARKLYGLPPRAIGYVGEGEEDYGTHLTIAMIQTLAKMPTKRLIQVGQRFGTVVVDEAQHTPALSMARVIGQFPARYRIGLSATPDRTDGLWPLAEAILGPGGRAIIDPGALLAHGRIVLPTVYIVPTGFECVGHTDWAALQRARAADARRNQIICTLAARSAQDGRRVIILAEMVAHARLIARALSQRFGVPAVAVCGEDPSYQRTQALRTVGDGRAVLVATKLADEGLDLPALDTLILAAPGRSAPRLQQQVGRIMRSRAGKSMATVYDLADTAVESLRNQALERLKVYRSLGFQVQAWRP